MSIAARISPIRLVDEAECVCSVLLAIGLAHLLGARNVSWAAFSGYMVLRGHLLDSVGRGLMRVVGTAAGAGLALLAAPLILPVWPLAVLAAAGMGGLTLYAAITARRAYAWLFTGLTFEMILLDAGAQPAGTLFAFAETRLLEVAAGTAACLVVSGLSALTLRRRWPADRLPVPVRLRWHAPAARHAAQAAVALALVMLLARFAGLPRPAQAAVSVMAAMIVPVTSLGASGLVPVSRKLWQRVAGCVGGALLAATVLFAAQGSPGILLAGTLLGVAMGRHLENSGHAYAYVGTQFVLAVLVTLVPDDWARAEIAPALERLGGIMAGLLILEPVLIAWHLLAPAAAARRGKAAPAPDGARHEPGAV